MTTELLSHEDRMELWRKLTFFERLYGWPSLERHKAFTGVDGRLRADQDYEQWSAAWSAWKIATRSEYIPECIDTHDLQIAAEMAMAHSRDVA